MKRGTENMNKNTEKNIFYKTNPRGGISLIVLVITIIVVIILAAAVIISLQNNNPMVEANKARINSDVANMQAIFTNTVGKIMAENQDVVQVVGGPLYTTPTGNKKTEGEATYQIVGADGTVAVEGKIKFSTDKSEGTTYCTGKELPLYSSDTKWSVDNQGLLSVEVGGVLYGEGEQAEDEGEEIAQSDNPMIRYYVFNSGLDFHNAKYQNKITKIKFELCDKVPNNVVELWDISKAQDKSVMAWLEYDGVEEYILTIAGRNKIVANTNSSYLFFGLISLKIIENMEILDTSNVTIMEGMFLQCRNLEEADLSKFDTSKVTNMYRMFSDCNNLKTLNTSNLDTSNVTSMIQIFDGCNNLTTSIDIANNNITSFGNMFRNSAIVSPAKITVNYTSATSSLVDSMIATKSENSNIVKGIQVD